jgi:GNAT superfamily N-acetyltransferase
MALMRIELLHSSDLDRLLALYTQLHPADSLLPERAEVESAWSELLGSKSNRVYGCFLDGQLIASCVLTVIANLTRSCKPYGLIENVVTRADHRNKGLGKALLAKALSDAWSLNCYKVMLQTGRKDEATLQFYVAAGFDRQAKQAFVAKPPSLTIAQQEPAQ